MLINISEKIVGKWNVYLRILIGLLVLLIVTGGSVLVQVEASSTIGKAGTSLSEPDENCLMCHSDPDFKGTFRDGEMISLHVDGGAYLQSVHGPAGLNCVACHTAISQYPHHSKEQVNCVTCHEAEGGNPDSYETLRVQLSFSDHRELTLTVNEECRACHEGEFEVAHDSAHVRVQEAGNEDAPVCVDCHGNHNIARLGESRGGISEMCGWCHKAVYSTYKSSVHGSALESGTNMDVPTCIECHGVHSVRGPRDASFRNDSIAICGDCHADEEMMESYGLSTDVFTTYVDDFHGRTVDLFRRLDQDAQSNKAVCFDCHGIHNIRRIDDPQSTAYPENLQQTCQQCHQEANVRFPDAWLSHYSASWDKTPTLYAVNVAYGFAIPGVLGFFAVYIGLDAGRRWKEKRTAVRQALEEEDIDDFDIAQEL